MRFGKSFLLLCLLFLASLAFAQNGVIRVTTLPGASVADSHSTISVTAYVYKNGGNAVPDGTQVLFSSTLGYFKEQTVQTLNGYARATLVAGGVPGTAKIQVSAFGVGAVSTTELEFFSDASLLNSAKEYVEIVAPGYMMYSNEYGVLTASGPGHGVRVRYREVDIEADDFQYDIRTFEIRAKKAHLHMGKVSQDFDELYLKLNQRKGFGYTTYAMPVPVGITSSGSILRAVMGTKDKYGLAQIRSSGLGVPEEPFAPQQMKFAEQTEAQSFISAKRAVVFPRKEIQFQKAEILVGDVKVLKLPLYVSSLTGNTAALPTEQIFSVDNNELAINYPHYLSLKPGQTSLLRFSTGQRYGRSSGVGHSLNLAYEMNWNRGDDFDGGLSIDSIGRSNWGLNARQYVRFDSRTTASAQLEVPALQSIYGNFNMVRQFNGFSSYISGSSTSSLRGNSYQTQQMSFTTATDPKRMGSLPFRMSYAVSATANHSATALASRSQDSFGLSMRSQLIPQRFDKTTTLNGSFAISELAGHNIRGGLSLSANASLGRTFGGGNSLFVMYDFLDTGFDSGLTGRHRLSMQGSLAKGRFDGLFYATRNLDIDRMSVAADLHYQLANLWRLTYSYTLDRYLGSNIINYEVAVGYRLGVREIGLVYSRNTKRIGIQILGAGIN